MRRKILITFIALTVIALTVSYVMERRSRGVEALDRVDRIFDSFEDLLFEYGLLMDEERPVKNGKLRDVAITLTSRSGGDERLTVRLGEIRLLEQAFRDDFDAPTRLKVEGRDLDFTFSGLTVPCERLTLDYSLSDTLFTLHDLALSSKKLGEFAVSFAAADCDADLEDWIWSRGELEITFTDDGAAMWKLLGASFCGALHEWLDDHQEIGMAATPLIEDLDRLECGWKRFTMKALPPVPTSLIDAADPERWDEFQRALEISYDLK